MFKYWLISLMLCSSLVSLYAEKSVDTLLVIEEQKESVVYITKTGEKYHKENCRHLSKSSIKISRKEAIRNGYAACKVCKP